MIQLFDDAFSDPFKISDAPSGHVNFATGVTASSQLSKIFLVHLIREIVMPLNSMKDL